MRYDFGSVNLPKRQKLTSMKKHTKVKSLDKQGSYCNLYCGHAIIPVSFVD